MRCDICGNVRTDGPLHCEHPNPLKGETMKLTETTEVITRGRTSKPNEFLDAKVLEQFKSGKTFNIEVDGKAGEKANTIVNQMRAAAATIGYRVSIGYNGTDTALKDAKSFRASWAAKSTG